MVTAALAQALDLGTDGLAVPVTWLLVTVDPGDLGEALGLPEAGHRIDRMPTFEITTGAFDQQARQHLSKQISAAVAGAGQPVDLVKVIFMNPESVFIHGQESVPAEQFARVEVTIGGLDDQHRRQLARAVCCLLCDAGIREDAMTLIFRDATGPQVAEGRGVFPFWPEHPGPAAG